MPTAGPFKGILAKGTGDLVDPATGLANAFIVFFRFWPCKIATEIDWQCMQDGPYRYDWYEIRIVCVEFFVLEKRRKLWFPRNTNSNIESQRKYRDLCFLESRRNFICLILRFNFGSNERYPRIT